MKFMEKAIYNLLINEPYFANFTLNSRIVYDKFNVETAGATVIGTSPVLIFNTKFMSSLTTDQVVSVLKHEILHLLFDHTSPGRVLTGDAIKDQVSHYFKNIAMDCTINQYITGLPEFAVTLESFKKAVKIKEIEAFQNWEYYYDLLKNLEEKNQQAVQDMLKTLDDHDLDVPGGQADGAVRRAGVRAASSRALRASAGNVSENLSKILGSMMDAENQVNWKQILKNFVASSVSNTKISTRKRPNRRYGMEFPGKKIKRNLKLGVCVDTSGSVGDDEYLSLMAEVVGMSKETRDIYLIQADCEVKKVDKIKGKKDFHKLERHGYGGTAYEPALVKARELGCNAIIYLGDMDCADVPNNPGVPVLWVTVGSTKRPGEFGHMVKIESKKSS